MKRVHLVVEITTIFGPVAYVESVKPRFNIKGINNAISISAYALKKDAQARADFLNELYKEQGRYKYENGNN